MNVTEGVALECRRCDGLFGAGESTVVSKYFKKYKVLNIHRFCDLLVEELHAR